ncbi:extracellular solute-binding protein [Cellulomonas sp. Marseille-Q8402]
MRNRTLAVAAAATAALLLTACAGGNLSGGSDGSSSEDAGGWNDATADLTGVTITFGGGTAGGPLDGAIEAFQEETGATIERTTYPDPYEQNLQTRVATGDVPDLASWQPTTSMLTSLQAPTNLLPLDDAPWLDRLDPAVRDIAGFVDDTRYAAITRLAVGDGRLLQQGAVREVRHHRACRRAWDEMVEVARTIAAGGDTAFVEAGGAQWPTQWAVQMQARRGGAGRTVGRGQHERHHVRRPADPGRDHRVPDARRRRPLQRRPEDGDVRGPGRPACSAARARWPSR